MPPVHTADTINKNIVSVFSNNLLHSNNMTSVLRAVNPYYWPIILLFCVFAIYVYLNVTNPKKLLRVFISVYSNQVSKQLYREDYRLSKSMSVFLSVGFVLIVSFLIYITNNYFGLILKGVYPAKQYLFFVSVITLMYIIKLITNYVLGYATLTSELNSEYTFNVFVYCQTLGVLLFPLAICIQFSKYPTELFLYPAIIICGLFYVLRFARGFIISVIEQNVGIVYIFLYLCALEILPLLVLIKFLLVNF